MALVPLCVEVDSEKIGLDNGMCENAFLSHAHSDHLSGIKKARNTISSAETRHLASLKSNEFFSPKIRMANAGHIVGARQLIAEEDGRKTVYTGDIRLRNGIFEKGAEIIECDRLIIEATYARKIFKFPDPFDVYGQIAKTLSAELLQGHSVILGAYSLGKSQELIKVVNEYLQLPVLTDGKITEFSKKYNELGMNLDFFDFNSENANEIKRESFVYLTSTKNANKQNAMSLSFQHSMPFKAFAATGWSMLFPFNNLHGTFPLSDHADFMDLYSYIEQSNAKEVVFFGGDANDMISHCKNNCNDKTIKSLKLQ